MVSSPRRFPIILLLVALSLLACVWLKYRENDAPWKLTDVTHHLPDLQFALTDDTGKPVTEADMRAKIVLLYFGFTQCPGICPMAMSHLAQILPRLEGGPIPVQVLFVSVDPTHDTPQALHEFLSHFGGAAHMTGLTGDKAAIGALAKRLRAANDTENGVPVHSNAIYIFDAAGHARLLGAADEPDASFIADLRRLAQSRDF